MAITKISPDVVDFDAGITISTADNLDTLTLTSTDADANSGPNLRLYRNSSSPADNDALGFVEWEGRNDNSQDVIYGQIGYYATDVSDGTEDSNLYINTIVGGTVRNRINAYNNEVVINEESIDSDFRVESDGNAKALVILGDKYGLGVGRDPESAYNGYSSIEFGQQGSIFGNDAGDDIEITINTYLDSSGNWKRKETGVSANLNLDGDQIKFFTAGSASADSTITFAQTLRIDTDGIKFGSDTAAANALDDYEEGTWNPTSLTGTIGTISHANYTKIGRLVHVSCVLEAFSDTSTNASITVGGLPFPVYRDQAAGSLMGINTSNTDATTTYINTNERMFFYQVSTGSWTTMTHANLSSSHGFYVQGTYQAE